MYAENRVIDNDFHCSFNLFLIQCFYNRKDFFRLSNTVYYNAIH